MQGLFLCPHGEIQLSSKELKKTLTLGFAKRDEYDLTNLSILNFRMRKLNMFDCIMFGGVAENAYLCRQNNKLTLT